MDSLTQITLGSAVSVAVMRKRVPVWQSALWGAAAGTAPDLDVIVDFGDAILNMTRHRAESHALVILTIVSPAFAALANWVSRPREQFLRWLLAFWLVFMTHVGVDYLTVYGTQLLQPLSDYPFGRGSIYIIDPLYTLPLLIGLLVCLASRSPNRLRWNSIGLTISSLYIAWGLWAQQHVERIALDSLPEGVDISAAMLVTPAPLNSILWRVVVVSQGNYYEGWYSLLDREPKVHWTTHDQGANLIASHESHPGVQRLKQFSHGFFRMRQVDDHVFVTDLRMGAEPDYFFNFDLGQVQGDGKLDPQQPSVRKGSRPKLDTALPWLWQRILGQTTQPPSALTNPP